MRVTIYTFFDGDEFERAYPTTAEAEDDLRHNGFKKMIVHDPARHYYALTKCVSANLPARKLACLLHDNTGWAEQQIEVSYWYEEDADG